MTTPATPAQPESTPQNADPAAPEATESAPTAPETQEQPATKPARRSLEDNLAVLDEDARKFVLGEVNKARNEAKNLRDRAKTADDGTKDLISKVAQALGIESPAPDPADLTQQLATQTAAAQDAQRELAVYRSSTTAEQASALLDSRSFMASIKDVDPSDQAAISEAIMAAASANPALAAAPVRRVPAPNPAQGTSSQGAPGLDDQIAAAQKAGDVDTVIRLQNQKLTAPQR